jgi:flagellar biosynthetic protein FliP
MRSWLLIILGTLTSLGAQTISFDLGLQDGGSTTGKVLQLLFTLTIIGMAPFLIMMVTSFTRIMVVLSFLRSAIGLQQSPPNLVMVALSLFLTGFIMEPVFQKAYTQGVEPLMAERIAEKEAMRIIAEPFKMFMAANTRPKDIILFQEASKSGPIENIQAADLKVLVPAFIISELRRAFEIGFLIYIPFLIIDMIVASILMSMGMMMLPPVVISLPFKVIFFVLVDGWHLVAGILIQSFH